MSLLNLFVWMCSEHLNSFPGRHHTALSSGIFLIQPFYSILTWCFRRFDSVSNVSPTEIFHPTKRYKVTWFLSLFFLLYQTYRICDDSQHLNTGLLLLSKLPLLLLSQLEGLLGGEFKSSILCLLKDCLCVACAALAVLSCHHKPRYSDSPSWLYTTTLPV